MSDRRSLIELLKTETPVSQNRPTGHFFKPLGKKARARLEKATPLKYLLECSDGGVGAFELAKLSEVANLCSQILELFDRLVDTSSLAVLAAMLRRIDRQEIVRRLLESPDKTFDVIMAEAKAQIRSQGHPEELEAGKMPSPSFLRKLPPGEARRRERESIKRWQECNIAKGKCRSCTAPLCRESVDYCKKHLAMRREAQRRRKGTIHTHGRHANTLAALKEANEKRKKT